MKLLILLLALVAGAPAQTICVSWPRGDTAGQNEIRQRLESMGQKTVGCDKPFDYELYFYPVDGRGEQQSTSFMVTAVDLGNTTIGTVSTWSSRWSAPAYFVSLWRNDRSTYRRLEPDLNKGLQRMVKQLRKTYKGLGK